MNLRLLPIGSLLRRGKSFEMFFFFFLKTNKHGHIID